MSPFVESSEAGAGISEREGTGILLNLHSESTKAPLISKLEHADIELSFDVMLARHAHSGIYLQGRYELQLFDSWGERNPSFADMGGIYRDWEELSNEIYLGKAPLSNAAKAPGLWQHVHLRFKAPRFDDQSNKIANARFVFVDLNGQRIHNNLEIPQTTAGSISKEEAVRGPLMFQGDHAFHGTNGTVAIRNIRYKLLSELSVALNDINYEVYEGSFSKISEFDEASKVTTGKSEKIDATLAGRENNYGVVFSGTITLKQADTYTFTLGHTGGVKFELDAKALIDHQNKGEGRKKASLELDAGTYNFTLYNFKTSGWRAPRLALFIEGKNTYPVSLHEYESYPQSLDLPSPIYDDVGAEPRLLRAFFDFYDNQQATRLSHTIGVGDPAGMHYVYDLNNANLVAMWRGDFVDATPMWHLRGDGSFRPRGAPVYTFNGHPIAQSAANKVAFHKQADRTSFRPRGYRLNKDTKQPIFLYDFGGRRFEHHIAPQHYTHLTNRLLVTDPITGDIETESVSKAPFFYKLAHSHQITKMEDNTFLIGDGDYYIRLDTAYSAQIMSDGEHKELIVQLNDDDLVWDVIW
ncbi:family 16 glycoside hydrolase [Ningiella sp. W23]|uniref:family 16 glycoside hydrolase n=1 Tax=Ningiella sp. W23 TaxID=3023715 RepID=UPI0037580F68